MRIAEWCAASRLVFCFVGALAIQIASAASPQEKLFQIAKKGSAEEIASAIQAGAKVNARVQDGRLEPG